MIQNGGFKNMKICLSIVYLMRKSCKSSLCESVFQPNYETQVLQIIHHSQTPIKKVRDPSTSSLDESH